MTTEISVMNRYAIALATDSAATISTLGHDKVYKGADKLFMLSVYAPVGVMVYGAAVLADIPWEPVIKYYRSQLGTTAFPNLLDHANHFWNFIETNEELFPSKLRELSLTRFVGGNFLRLKRFMKNSDLTMAQFLEQLRQYRESLNGRPDDSHIKITDDTLIRSIIEEQIKEVYADTELDAQGVELLASIGMLLLVKELDESQEDSGLVIAGYGENEIFGTIVNYHVACFVGHALKYRRGETISAHDVRASVRAFAQQDMVALFMTGIDPELYHWILETTQQSFSQIAESVGDASVNDLASHFEEMLRKAIWEFSSARVVNAIQYLPKDELAAFAESLIGLTALKRRVTLDSETVSGPVDVAVLSKGDGFVWIKRKHYFDPGLNPYYFARLQSKFGSKEEI